MYEFVMLIEGDATKLVWQLALASPGQDLRIALAEAAIVVAEMRRDVTYSVHAEHVFTKNPPNSVFPSDIRDRLTESWRTAHRTQELRINSVRGMPWLMLLSEDEPLRRVIAVFQRRTDDHGAIICDPASIDLRQASFVVKLPPHQVPSASSW